MTLKNFLAAVDVLPSNVKVSPEIRITAYTLALQGQGLQASDFDEILARGLREWKFYPTPAEILDMWGRIRAKRYRALMADSVGIEGPDGRIRIVPMNSPEGQVERAKREQTALPEEVAAGETALKSKLNELAVKFAEPLKKPEKEYEVRELVDDPDGVEDARAMIAAQVAEL